MKCPTCRGRANVIATRSADSASQPTLRRRYVCHTCRARFSTVEVVVGDRVRTHTVRPAQTEEPRDPDVL